MKLILVTLLLTLSSTIFAQTDCRLNLRIRNLVFTWDGNTQVVTGDVRLRRRVYTTQCNFFRVGFSEGSAGNYNRRMFRNADYVAYNIYRNSTTNIELQSLDDYSSFDENLFFFFQNTSDRVIDIPIEARLPIPNDGRELLANRNYIDTITATATGVFTNTLTATDNFRVRVNIPPEIDISLVNPGGTFDENATSYLMNFGNLNQGDSQSVDLKVRSNAGYSVEITSQNGGSLKHTTESDLISYQLQVNGSNQSFPGPGSPLNIGSTSGVTPNEGVNFNLSFEIGNPANKTAGQYQDTITVTAISID